MAAPRTEQQAQQQPITDRPPVCWRCKRALGEYVTRPWSIKCKRCGAENRSPSCTG